MVLLSKLKVVTLRLCYSPSSCIVASTFKRFVVGYVKSSHFLLQNLLLCRHFTSEISETHHDFTVNYLIYSCGLSPECAISASKWVKLRSPKRADSVLSLLRNHGFSETQISSIVRNHCPVLNSNPEKTLMPKLEFFASLGVSKGDLAKALAYGPKLLSTSLEKQIAPTYDFLRSLLSQKNVISVLRRDSWIFAEGHSKKVAPNLEVLKKNRRHPRCNGSNGFFGERDGVVLKNDCKTATGSPLQFGEEIGSKGLIKGIENVNLSSLLEPVEKVLLGEEKLKSRMYDGGRSKELKSRMYDGGSISKEEKS
ncbi:unnamed protein product [Malus baccata var. baccata]